MTLMEKIKIIERVDALIRRKGTGTAKDLSQKLDMSRSNVFRLINVMKEMGAPIFYCDFKKSYCYKFEVEFTIGFIQKHDLLSEIIGGKKNNLDFFTQSQNLRLSLYNFAIDNKFFN